jgi:Ni,Fe-hydrogenase III small subunit
MGLKLYALTKSPWVYHLATGSCNNCDIEILDCLTLRHDLSFRELFGGSRVTLTPCWSPNMTMKHTARQGRTTMAKARVIAVGTCGLATAYLPSYIPIRSTKSFRSTPTSWLPPKPGYRRRRKTVKHLRKA